MRDIREALARNLKRLRAERRISQEKLAEAIGVSKETIAKTETRQNWLGAEKLNAIMDFFGVEPEELFAAPDAESPRPLERELVRLKAEIKRELELYVDYKLSLR